MTDHDIDPSEWALHSVVIAAEEFKDSIRKAENPHRLVQLRERLRTAVQILTAMQDVAAAKHEVVTRG